MKKKRWNSICNSGWTKIFFMMRITMFFVFAGLLQLSASVYSQQTVLNLKVEKANVSEVLRLIEDQSDFQFLYRSDNLTTVPEVSVDMHDAKLEDVLDKVITPYGFTYEVDDRTVVIKRAEASDANNPAAQQKNAITGSVVDTKGLPIPGATVSVKGTNTGVTTDMDGKFSLTVASDAKTLVVSFIGMNSQELAIAGKSSFTVSLKEQAVQLSEIVTMGYGVTTTREKISGSVSTISPKLLADRGAVTSPLNLITGLATGVRVTSSTSLTGTTPSVQIREVSSWKSGAGALYVIDGVVMDVQAFQALNPNDIASMSILKDAASAAIYGMKAGEGVILVTTKVGESGKAKINYGFQYASSNPIQLVNKLSAYEYALQQNRWSKMIGRSATAGDWYLPYELDFFKTHNYSAFNDFWQDPVSKNHNISASGGSEKTKYFVSGSWNTTDQQKLSVNYEKYTVLTKIESKLTDRLTFNFRMSASWDKNVRPTSAGGAPGANSDISGSINGNDLNYGNLYLRPATQPYAMMIDGVNYPLDPTIASVMYGKSGNSQYFNTALSTTGSLKYRIPGIEGLSASSTLTYNNRWNKDRQWSTSPYYYNIIYDRHIPTAAFNFAGANGYRTRNAQGNNTYNSLTQNYGSSTGYQGNLQLNYARSFGQHNIAAFAGYEFRGSQGDAISAYRRGFALESYNQINGGSTDPANQSTSGDISSQEGMASYIGRLDYDFAGKYILGATMRRDGSYKFAPSQKWGNFPAASAAWIVSKESFFEPVKNVINSFKLRGSYGLTGTDTTNPWQWMDMFSGGSQATINTDVYSTLSASVVPNPFITWEKNANTNLGVEFGVLNNTLTFAIEGWNKRTTDILSNRLLSTPTIIGANLPDVNYGIMKAWGTELTVNYANKIGEVNFSVGANASYNKNKVLVKDLAAGTRAYDIEVGQPTYRLRNWMILQNRTGNGVIRTQAEALRVAAENAVGATRYTTTGGQVQPGQVFAQDLRGSNNTLFSNSPDGNVNQNTNDDKVWFPGKYGSPRMVFGLNANISYKGWNINMIAAGVGSYWRSWDRGYTANFSLYSAFWPDEWTQANINGMPSPIYAAGGSWPGGGTDKPSTLNLYNMQFLRMKNMSVSYTIPAELSKRVGIQGVKLFINMENPFMIYKLCPKIMEPEATEGSYYPILRSYSLGVNITL